jgi:uncharacterized protein (DUF1501 family)
MNSVPRTFWTEMSLVPAVSSIANFRYTSVNNGNADQRANEIRTLKTALDVADGQPEGEFLRSSIRTALDEADTLAAAGTISVDGSYPNNGFGNSMKMVAQVTKANIGTSIFYVSLGGFDTHSNQLAQQASLLSTFDQSVDALLVDMERIGKLGDLTIMTFSEFGRRVAQNGSNGTDHGVAAPHFVIGGGVNGGLYSDYPSMSDLMSGDLKMQVDFRSMYGTILRDWLNIPADGILGGTFPTLGLFGAAASSVTTAPALRRTLPLPMRRQPSGGRP